MMEKRSSALLDYLHFWRCTHMPFSGLHIYSLEIVLGFNAENYYRPERGQYREVRLVKRLH